MNELQHQILSLLAEGPHSGREIGQLIGDQDQISADTYALADAELIEPCIERSVALTTVWMITAMGEQAIIVYASQPAAGFYGISRCAGIAAVGRALQDSVQNGENQ